MVVWVSVAALGAVSYLMRLLPLIARGDRPLSPRTGPVLRDAGMGGLAALTAVSFLGLQGHVPPPTAVGVALSALVGAVIAATGRSMALAVGAGGLVLALTWGLTAALGW
jgi:branched-subunit amino acid transport protein